MSRRKARGAREPVIVEISDLSHEGRGVGRIDGKTVFVHGALPGEKVRARVIKRRGRFDEAETTEVLEPSDQRVAPRCPHFGVCGGCSLQHMPEQAQLQHKQSVLLELLWHHAQTKPEKTAAPVRSPQWGYRRKARLGVKYVDKKGGVIMGFRERAKPYITDCHQCDVLDERVSALLDTLRGTFNQLSIAARIPQLEIAITDNRVAMVIRHLDSFSDSDLDGLQRLAQAAELDFYLQSGGLDTVVPLTGNAQPLSYDIAGVTLKFEPFDFTQVNQVVNEKMVARAIELLAPTQADYIADYYCGIGNFSLPLGRYAGRVIGVEGDAGLIERARANAEMNGISTAGFACADLADPTAIAALKISGHNKVLLDPPRAGAAELLAHADFSAVERLVYVSCNPVTLARDTNTICHQLGFRLVEAGILDMFPHTAHVESMAYFERS